jgi:hypothetical protein
VNDDAPETRIGRLLADAVPPMREPADRLAEVRARVRRSRLRTGGAAIGAVAAVAALALAVPQLPLASPPVAPAAVDPAAEQYQGTAMVIEGPEHDGPRLCPAASAQPAPMTGGGGAQAAPTCQGPAPAVVGWDWDEAWAEGFEAADGITWGIYRLVGAWDGERFTLTAPPMPPDPVAVPGSEVDFSTPCREPSGGWRPVDPERATSETLDQVLTEAEQLPAYAGSWVDQSAAPGTNDPTQLVLNLRFTGDLDGRVEWVRQRWGGALCVSNAERSWAELLEIQERLLEELPQWLSGGPDVQANAVAAEVLIATRELQRELDQRYGAGAVVLHGWLAPAR